VLTNLIRVALVLSGIVIVDAISADDRADFTPPPLKVPAGFTIEVVAAPPLVKYPMMGCLDERGRLFIAETLGQNLNKEQLLEKRHRFIRMLEDIDQDGKFDKSTIFADKLVMPEGALWHRGSLFVLSSPYLWRFEDTNDDGVADIREKLVGYMDFTGQANQHGAYLGPNGRIYFSGGHLGYDLKTKDGTRCDGRTQRLRKARVETNRLSYS
jgi:putative membrane-bound dehydrogenase-like protein